MMYSKKFFFTIFLLFLAEVFIFSAEGQVVPSSENRIALVIGNKDYQKAPLDNPINDAQDMKTALEQVGFKVVYRENANLSEMNEAVREFAQQLNKNSVGVVYYSGHGAQADGVNYLIPVETDIKSKAELKSRAYDAGIILDEMKDAGSQVNVVILDACRNNPFKGFKGAQDGLATMSGPKGTVIAYATAPGSVASDSDSSSGRNGLYTGFLKQFLVQPGLKIEEVFKKVREAVVKVNPDQIPWENSSLSGDFCFNGCNAINSANEALIKEKLNLEKRLKEMEEERSKQKAREGKLHELEKQNENLAQQLKKLAGKKDTSSEEQLRILTEKLEAANREKENLTSEVQRYNKQQAQEVQETEHLQKLREENERLLKELKTQQEETEKLKTQPSRDIPTGSTPQIMIPGAF